MFLTGISYFSVLSESDSTKITLRFTISGEDLRFVDCFLEATLLEDGGATVDSAEVFLAFALRRVAGVFTSTITSSADEEFTSE